MKFSTITLANFTGGIGATITDLLANANGSVFYWLIFGLITGYIQIKKAQQQRRHAEEKHELEIQERRFELSIKQHEFEVSAHETQKKLKD